MTRSSRGARGLAWLAGLTAVLLASAAPAWAWPERALRIVVPFPAGGPTDVVMRAVAEELGAGLGQATIVENRPGAGGTLGAGVVARAQADGYTLLMGTTSTQSIGPYLEKTSYDPRTGFTPIGCVGRAPNLLAVSPKLAVNSVAELIALAKREPGKLNYASSGVGTIVHLTSEAFKRRAGIALTHVPYKGIQDALPDLISGEISILFESVLTAQPHLKAGRLRALAMASAERSPLLPELPTLAEAGLAGFESVTWFGLFGPAGLPAPIVERVNAELNRVLAQTPIRERFARLGVEAVGGTPGSLAELTERDAGRWSALIAELGLRGE